jgi:hypothetical protein
VDKRNAAAGIFPLRSLSVSEIPPTVPARCADMLEALAGRLLVDDGQTGPN